jgi:hypothetical protein
MSEIVSMKGERLSTEHKRAHDPARVMKRREELSGLLEKMKGEWAVDMSIDPQGATGPDEVAVTAHYDKRWRDQAIAVMNSSDPVEIDPDAMLHFIQKELAQKKLKRELQTPLSKLESLGHVGFSLIGEVNGGKLWVSTECAVLIFPGGLTRVIVRHDRREADLFVQTAIDIALEGNGGTLELNDYRLGELTQLLQALRREQPTLLPPQLIRDAQARLL